VPWSVSVKRVECLRWLLDMNGQELMTGMGHGEGAVVVLGWSLPRGLGDTGLEALFGVGYCVKEVNVA
jgi:hypothetical protein